MRRAAPVVLAAFMLAACGGGGGGSSGSSAAAPSTLPGELVPATATSASVAVTVDGKPNVTTVGRDALSKVLPLLLRRQFTPVEPLANYGLDVPRALITFTLPDGSTVALQVGDEEFDNSARYVRRAGDSGSIWIVLNQSLDPLLNAGTINGASGAPR